MAGGSRCDECGARLAPESSPGGLCPKCLLKLALPESGGEPARTRTESSARPPSRRIGPYHLHQKIGEGGMGEVWLAEQWSPLRRKVALKLIKKGLDTTQVVARFEAERQALALMNQPGPMETAPRTTSASASKTITELVSVSATIPIVDSAAGVAGTTHVSRPHTTQTTTASPRRAGSDNIDLCNGFM
jgi:serine/threonine protein kinase